jgi:hypothetical protein
MELAGRFILVIRLKFFDLDSPIITSFEFKNAGCASVDRRSNYQMLADSAQALWFFRSIAPALIELYGDNHQIQVSDLVMSQL